MGLFRTFHTHTTMLNAHPTIFCFRVLGLFRTFHTHTTMLNAHPTIVCFRVLGLFRTFHTHTHHDAQRPPHDSLSFGFVPNIPHTHHDTQQPPHDCLFPSFGFVPKIPHTHEFWVCCRVLVLFGFIPPDIYWEKLSFSIPILIQLFKVNAVPLEPSSIVHCEYCIFK